MIQTGSYVYTQNCGNYTIGSGTLLHRSGQDTFSFQCNCLTNGTLFNSGHDTFPFDVMSKFRMALSDRRILKHILDYTNFCSKYIVGKESDDDLTHSLL